MTGTLVAIFKAFRALYVVILLLGTVAFLFPGLGLRDRLLNATGGHEGLVQLALGWIFLGLLIEHTRGTILQKRQAILARAIMRNRPDLRKQEAMGILIRALHSDDNSVVENAHRELTRLAGTDLGRDPKAWQRWLHQQQKQSMDQEVMESQQGG